MSDRKVKMSVVFEAVDKAVSRMTGIRKSGVEMAKQLAKARKELSELNKVQGDINSFRRMKKAIGENSAKLTEAQAKVARLAAEMRKVDKPTRDMERTFGRAKREAADLGQKIDRDSQSIQRLRDKLRDAGVSTRDLANAQKDLKRRIEQAGKEADSHKGAYADYMASGQGAKQAPGNGPGSTTDKAVKAGLILGTIKEAGDILATPVISDAQAQEQLTQIGLKANLSRGQLQRMREEINQLAPQVRKTTGELRSGVDFLAASGLDPRAALKMMEPIGKASHAYKAEISDLAQATNAALANLKIPLGPNEINRTREAAHMLEIMAVAGNEGNFEIKDMARHFPTLTARLSALNQQGAPAVANLAAALQVAWKATGDADQAANNIDNLLLKINSKETVANFKKFGVDLPAAMQKAYREGKGPLEAIADLTNKATGGDMRKLSHLFGDEQAQTGVLALIQNMKEYRKIRDDTLSQSAQGQIDRDFAKVADDTASRWERVQARWSVLKDTIGENLRAFTNAAIKRADWMITPTTESSVRGKSVKIGNDVGDGLALGLRQKQGAVRAASAQLAEAMPKEVRRNLQVHSPSRVFMAIGRHVADGLTVGIDRNRNHPARAAGRMATSVAAAGAISLNPMHAAARSGAGGGGSGGGFGPIEVHIHASPGMNVDELADAAIRKLERLQARQSRSSFEDR